MLNGNSFAVSLEVLLFKRALITTALAAVVALAVPVAHAQSGSCKLVVHVSGFRNTKGVAGGTIFNNPDGWPENNDKALKHGSFPIDAATKTAVITFDGLTPGAYSFAVIHDENENKKLDKNMIGIPKEGFGFANNPHVGLSAPAFKDASVNVACPETVINVTLQYK
jgi:uncharacterized protein (DUF2141 family)